MNGSRSYRLEMEILSPVHVGSGRGALIRDLDFVIGKEIHAIDTERFFADLPIQRWTGTSSTAGLRELMKPEQYESYALYSLGDPSAIGDMRQILDCVKDAQSRPYLPGSSLKGAIRTALAWAILNEEEVAVDKRDLGYNPRFADDPLMARLFGIDPNHDLLRCLQVGDSEPVSDRTGLEATVVALYTLRGGEESKLLEPKGPSYRFAVESLRPGLRIFAPIRIDGFLAAPEQARWLRFGDRVKYVTDFTHHCNDFSKSLIGKEIEFFNRHGLPAVMQFYRDLARNAENLEEGRECLLQISWGTGWSAKTLGTALSQEMLDAARYQFHLGRTGHVIFPKTRKIVEREKKPASVMGWVIVRLHAVA